MCVRILRNCNMERHDKKNFEFYTLIVRSTNSKNTKNNNKTESKRERRNFMRLWKQMDKRKTDVEPQKVGELVKLTVTIKTPNSTRMIIILTSLWLSEEKRNEEVSRKLIFDIPWVRHNPFGDECLCCIFVLHVSLFSS